MRDVLLALVLNGVDLAAVKPTASRDRDPEIDIYTPALLLEMAVGLFLRSQANIAALPVDQIRRAAELVARVAGGGSCYECERAAVEEFVERLTVRLGDEDDDGRIMRRVRTALATEFPVRH